MGGTEEIDEFVSAINKLIEGAQSVVEDPNAFLEVNNKIHALIEAKLPSLVEAVDRDLINADTRERLGIISASIQRLEGKARARLFWSRAFEDHLRDALSKDG